MTLLQKFYLLRFFPRNPNVQHLIKCRSLCCHSIWAKREIPYFPVHKDSSCLCKTQYRLCSRTLSNRLEEQCIFQSLSSTLNKGIFLDDLGVPELISVSEMFNLKSLNITHLHKYNVKVSTDLCTLMFPYDSLKKELAAIHSMTYKKDGDSQKLTSNCFPYSDENILFGWSLVNENQHEIVLTSDPLDAIAVNQVTGMPAVSLPPKFDKFSIQLLNWLKSFKRVIFWLKPELHDWKTHKLLANSLGNHAFFIRPQDSMSALSSLQNGLNLTNLLMEAYSIFDENVETFDSYIDIIREDILHHERNSGLKWTRFAALNQLLKGHRRGELTIFSGHTGSGKTTFMSEYSLDLCMQGLPTLWASFEITNPRLMKTMLAQLSKCSLVENVKDYGYWANEFCKIPMFFLHFTGPRSLKRILKAMCKAVAVYNIQHVIVDNLQFMMNMESYSSSLDQYRRQDQIYGAFRDFATHWNCHVTLVIHPRKEPEYTELNNTSISGTAKATQEADNILILQTTKSRQYLQVTKNRFDGQKGCILVEFDKKSQTFNVQNMTFKVKDTERTIL